MIALVGGLRFTCLLAYRLGCALGGGRANFVRLDYCAVWAVVVHGGIDEHEREAGVGINVAHMAVLPGPAIIGGAVCVVVNCLVLGEVLNIHKAVPLVWVGFLPAASKYLSDPVRSFFCRSWQ